MMMLLGTCTFSLPRICIHLLTFYVLVRYLREEGKSQGYDVIICDSSDPVGPAETLFKPEFFLSMREALSPGGVVCTQAECLWLHLDLINNVLGSAYEYPSYHPGTYIFV